MFNVSSCILFHLVDENPGLSTETDFCLNLCSATFLKGKLFDFFALHHWIKLIISTYFFVVLWRDEIMHIQFASALSYYCHTIIKKNIEDDLLKIVWAVDLKTAAWDVFDPLAVFFPIQIFTSLFYNYCSSIWDGEKSNIV